MSRLLLAAGFACALFAVAPARASDEPAAEAVGHEAQGHEATAEGHGEGHETTAEGHGEGHEEGGHKGGGHHGSPVADMFAKPLADAFGADLGTSMVANEPVTDVAHVVLAVFVFVLILVLLAFAVVKLRKDPGNLLPEQKFSPLAVFQILTDALLGLMEQIMGREKALKFLPLVGSLGLFILFSNLMGLIPYFLPPTSNLNTTFALGSVVFFATHYYGVRSHGIAYFKHFFGPIIKWYALPLMLLMFAIELISHIARPVSLGIRLFGNMFGDHAAVAAFLGVGMFGWVLIPVIPLPLGILVCVVQTLVFCVLSTVYIHMATEEEEHEEGAAHGH